jgi:hypothetical protein
LKSLQYRANCAVQLQLQENMVNRLSATDHSANCPISAQCCSTNTSNDHRHAGQPQAAFNKPVISKEADQVLHWTVRRLATAASSLLILKGLPALLQLLGLSTAASSLLGGILGSKAADNLTAPGPCHAGNADMLCGKRVGVRLLLILASSWMYYRLVAGYTTG